MSGIAAFFSGVTLLLIAIGVHEFAHAWTADYLGDSTARYRGRVTLDPLAHLDPIGTLMILFTAVAGVGIGWGRPVPVVPGNMRKSPLTAMAITSAVGPLSNLGQAVVAAALLAAVRLAFPALPSTAVTIGQGVVVVAGVVALAAGAALAYRWYRERSPLQPSAHGDYSWRVVDSTRSRPLWENEETLKQLVRGGMGGVLVFGFLAGPVGLLRAAIYMNIGLALFNLIPLGPLDGAEVLRGLLLTIRARWTYQVANFLDRIEPHSGLILFGLIMIDRFIPILSVPLWGTTSWIAGLLGA